MYTLSGRSPQSKICLTLSNLYGKSLSPPSDTDEELQLGDTIILGDFTCDVSVWVRPEPVVYQNQCPPVVSMPYTPMTKRSENKVLQQDF